MVPLKPREGGKDLNDKQAGIEIRTAIKQGDTEKVVALIGSDRSRLEMMTVFGSWLHVAAHHGQLEIVKRLVSLGADVNRRGGVSGAGPLDDAAGAGHKEIVLYLLSKGATMDVSEPNRNPLFGAIYSGQAEIARILIENGIDTTVKYTGDSMKNMDALAFAKEWGRTEIIELLQEASAKKPAGKKKKP